MIKLTPEIIAQFEAVRDGRTSGNMAALAVDLPATTFRNRYKRWVKGEPMKREVLPAQPQSVTRGDGDEWTIPQATTTRTAALIEEKRAPARVGTFKKFVAFSDLHGDKQHPQTVKTLLDFTKDWRPHYKIGLGDFFDFAPMRDGATIEEKCHSMRPDWDAACEVLREFFRRDSGENHAVLGNHCHRPFKWADKIDAVQREFAFGKINTMKNLFDELRVNWKPYHKRSVIEIGKLIGVHGFGGGGVNAAKQHAQWYATAPGSVILFGHTHRVALHSESNIAAPQCYNVGCTCELDLGYNDLQPGTLAQRHGFAYGAICERSGTAVVWQAQEIDGQWFLPSDVAGL